MKEESNPLNIILDELMENPDVVEKFRAVKEEKDLTKFHFGIGMYLRNNLNLWEESDNSKFFNSIGIFHPDDMSGIILTSFYRKVHKLPLKLMEQTEFYKKFWAEQRSL